jgi:hypothetical protein
MSGFLDILKGERGFLAILIIVCSTVLVALGHMTIVEWTDLTKWIAGFFIAGKSITTVAGLFADAKKEAALSANVNPPDSSSDVSVVANITK